MHACSSGTNKGCVKGAESAINIDHDVALSVSEELQATVPVYIHQQPVRKLSRLAKCTQSEELALHYSDVRLSIFTDVSKTVRHGTDSGMAAG